MERTKNIITTNWIYFYHLKKCCIIPVYPESVNDGQSISFMPSSALGRSASVYSFSKSDNRQFNVQLKLHKDMMKDIDFSSIGQVKDNVVPFWDDDYVDTLAKYIQSSAVPKYQVYQNGSKAVIPPRIALKIGDDIFIRGIISGQVNANYSGPILTYNDGSQHYAEIDLSFSVIETDPYDAETVAKVGSFRGLTAAFKDGIFRSTYETFDDAVLDSAAYSNLTNMIGGQSNNNTGDSGTTTTDIDANSKIYFIYYWTIIQNPEWSSSNYKTTQYIQGPGKWVGKIVSRNKLSTINLGNCYCQIKDDVALSRLGWKIPTINVNSSTQIRFGFEYPDVDHWMIKSAYDTKFNKGKDVLLTEYSPSTVMIKSAEGAIQKVPEPVSVGRDRGSFDNSISRGGDSFKSIGRGNVSNFDDLDEISYRTYNYTSRYSDVPISYSNIDNRYVCCLPAKVEKTGTYTTHQVTVYDTLDSLSLSYYGRPDMYWMIAEYNDITDPTINLYENFKTLKIPTIY